MCQRNWCNCVFLLCNISQYNGGAAGGTAGGAAGAAAGGAAGGAPPPYNQQLCLIYIFYLHGGHSDSCSR